MDENTIFNLIGSRYSENTIRDIVSNLKITAHKGKSIFHGIIYFIIFKDLNSLYRRVSNEINPETSSLDVPVLVEYSTIDNCVFSG